MLIEITTALIATAMLATAIGTTPSFARSNRNGGCIPQYDSSGAQTEPYCPE